jgi:Kef-type K+ transport system membrane component KefB/nucleotide-binding universal stress UspA family protein
MERVAAYDLIVISSMIWIGYVGSKLLQKIKLPAVSGFLLVGILLGPQVFNVINPSILHRLSFIEPIALSVITFMIGEQLQFKKLITRGNRALLVSVFEIVLTPLITYYLIFLVTGERALALLLGILSMTTAPATTVAVITETRSKGRLTEIVSTSVALNNIIAVSILSIFLPIAVWATSDGLSLSMALISSSKNIVFSLAIGVATSFALALLVPRLENMGELFIFVLGHIMLAYAICLVIGGSPILATLFAGVLTANLLVDEAHNRRIFGSLKVIAEPIYLIFFVLAGASLRFDLLLVSGVSLLMYVLGRSIGKILGPLSGGLLAGFSFEQSRDLSLSFLSQSAIAIGLSLVVMEQYLVLGEHINAIILGAVIFFELIGPYLFKRSLEKSGEAGQDKQSGSLELGDESEKKSIEVLVPIGTKLLSPRSARLVGQMVRQVNGNLVALHIMTVRSQKGWEPSRNKSEQVIEAFRDLMQKENIDFRLRVENSNKIAETISRVAREENVGLVIMGASGRSKFLNRLFAGLPEKVTNLLDCPVVVMPKS